MLETIDNLTLGKRQLPRNWKYAKPMGPHSLTTENGLPGCPN